MTPETTRETVGIGPGPVVPEGLPDAVADLASLGDIAAGKPLYVVVSDVGEHLSHHRTPEGAQSAWDANPDAVGIHETELYR